MEKRMKKASLCGAIALACLLVTSAFAVDNVTSRDAPMLQTYQHADVYNLMGFSLRKTGDQKQAYTFYRKALDFDPQHKGALEYLGELYVETGQIDKARENVTQLKKLCPGGCEELADLEKTIAEASKTN
jgi:tetratricopeptide (TPR) repeat protein